MSKNQFNPKSFKTTMGLLATQYDNIMSPKKEEKEPENKQDRSSRFSEWTTKEWEDWQRGEVY